MVAENNAEGSKAAFGVLALTDVRRLLAPAWR